MQIHQLKGYIQSIYLVEYADKLLLLDGCSRPDVKLVQSFIEDKLQRPFSDLKLVLVTHMHPDHAGGAHKLRALSGCKIASSAQKGQWYGGLHGASMFMTDIILAWWMATKMKKPKVNILYSPYLFPDYKLQDGATLPEFADWQVLHTAGHTDRDLSAYHLASRTAYTGDLIIKLRKGYVPPFPVFYPQIYRQSLAKVHNLAIDTLLLAHGGIVAGEADWFAQILPQCPKKPLNVRGQLGLLLRKRLHKLLRHQG